MKINDEKKVMISRWYLAGASYFFIAFGTPLGSYVNVIDLIFTLSLVIGMGTIFLLEPICYRAFEIQKNNTNVNLQYFSRKGWCLVLYKFFQLLRVVVLVLIVAFLYIGINKAINSINDFSSDTVALKGEPILFATFYCFFYWVSEKLIILFKRK